METLRQNFSAAHRMTMPPITFSNLRSLTLHQNAKAMQPISGFRRMRVWIPSGSAIFRAAAPRWVPWI
jgi:hypothetical protein